VSPGYVDYDRNAVTYEAGRSGVAHPAEWGRLVEPILAGAGAPRVLDVGAGTGIFAREWPGWGARLVIALDPSPAMLTEARRVGMPPAVACLAGRAETLPLAAGTVDVAWLSAVIHHIADPVAAARELRRVVVPGGTVLIRGFFAGASRLGWLPYFPGAERAVARFPSVEDVAGAFGPAGFRLVTVEEVAQPPATLSEVRAWLVRMRHVDTLLTTFTDHEFDTGLATLDAEAEPLLGGSLHLVVLR
jgi:SAM-dependent methyltransferase